MKKYIFILASILFGACENPPDYYQFTPDDLSHLYFYTESFTYTGDKVLYKDTLGFILNDTSSIYLPVTTEIYSLHNPTNFTNTEDMHARSLMIFDKKTGFDSVCVSISNTGNYKYAEKFFQLNANGLYPFTQQYSQTENVVLDTALVLGKVYQNVYKFYPLLRFKTGIRLIYFAKKYGYIKIEKTDGSKLERINKDRGMP